jgi:hypothetical protein
MTMSDAINTSPEAVERFDINWRDYRKDIDANGDYVTYEDYAALSAKLTTAHATGKAEGLRAAADACEAQKAHFLSPEYATRQPLSSHSERFACGVCAAAILALIPTDTPAAKVALGGWQPIKTAPKMEAVLISGGDVLYPIVASRTDRPDEGWWLDAQGAIEGNNAAAFYPTKWMSLGAIAGGQHD